MDGPERREHPRFDVSLRMQFRDLGALQDEEVKNLSRGGALVLARTMRPIGAKVPVTLVHPVNGSTIDILAEVRRIQPLANGSWAIGVQFVGFDDTLRLKIHDFVDSVTSTLQSTAATGTTAESKLASYLGLAAREESAGAWREVLRNLDLALALAPDRADLHAWKARMLAEKLGQGNLALGHAERAAKLDPSNEAYSRIARELAAKTGVAAPPTPWSESEPAVPRTVSRRRFLPAGGAQWVTAGLATAAVLGIGGFNVWYWLLRHAGGLRAIDPEPYRRLVPMTSLKIDRDRAYGVVERDWSTKDRAANLSDLARELAPLGVADVYLTGGDGKLVATYRGGAAKVY